MSPDPLNHRLHGVAVYNPDLLSEDELKSLFVARQELLTRLADDLRVERPQHKLILGVRGMGKTTLLRRLRYAIQDDPDLGRRWLPLVFPEEQYNVTRLFDFYLNCLDALADALEQQGNNTFIAELDKFTNDIQAESPEDISALALDGLMNMSKKLDRRLVLLVDNVERILDGLTTDESWSLRGLLADSDRVVLIGASTQAVESSYEYNKPFYDFFQVHELKGYSVEETETVLRHLGERLNQPQVARWIDTDRGRLKTLNVLSGGNPRTVVLLFHLLVQGIEGDVRSDLERLLDLCTPLYKARFEELAPQAQQVLDALALHWDPATAAQVADSARLETSAVSSQLTRLVKQGVVEQVPLPPGKRVGYQIAERFFNIWYLMRASRRIRRRLMWLVKFLRIFYTEPELATHARMHLQHSGKPEDSLRYAEYGLALADAIGEPSLQQALEASSLRLLVDSESTRREIHRLFDLAGADSSLRPKLGQQLGLNELKNLIYAAKPDLNDWNAEQFWKLLSGSISLQLPEKLTIAGKLPKLTSEQVANLKTTLQGELAAFAKIVGSPHLASRLWQAISDGLMSAVDDVAGADAAAQAFNCPELPVLALAASLERDPTAERAASLEERLKAVPLCYGCAALGDALSSRLMHHSEAEAAYRKAIELDPKYALPWNNLGNLLKNHLARYDEAEAAYRKAIELDPADASPWVGLGNLLQVHLARYDEAEAAYRKAIELAPADARPWNNLGNLLQVHLARYDEAEAAYRKAIELDPADARPWVGLGNLLQDHLARYDDAEVAAQRAVELAPDDPRMRGTLSCILIRNRQWFASVEHARRFLTTSDESFFETGWPGIVRYCREAVQAGHAGECAELLRECGRAEQWLPLYEALLTASETTADRLQRLAPEVRQPAEEIYRELTTPFEAK